MAWSGVARLGMAGFGKGLFEPSSFEGHRMFESNEQIGGWVEAIYAICRDLNRGDVLTHAMVKGILDCEPHTGPWGHVVRKVRRRLQDERGIATWPEREVGYKLCTASEQLALPAERLRRGIRQVRRGRRSVEALPTRGLTMHQRMSQAFAAERSRDAERAMRAELRQLTREAAPAARLPRRPNLEQRAAAVARP